MNKVEIIIRDYIFDKLGIMVLNLSSYGFSGYNCWVDCTYYYEGKEKQLLRIDLPTEDLINKAFERKSINQ